MVGQLTKLWFHTLLLGGWTCVSAMTGRPAEWSGSSLCSFWHAAIRTACQTGKVHTSELHGVKGRWHLSLLALPFSGGVSFSAVLEDAAFQSPLPYPLFWLFLSTKITAGRHSSEALLHYLELFTVNLMHSEVLKIHRQHQSKSLLPVKRYLFHSFIYCFKVSKSRCLI